MFSKLSSEPDFKRRNKSSDELLRMASPPLDFIIYRSASRSPRNVGQYLSSALIPLTPQQERRLEKTYDYYKHRISEAGGEHECLEIIRNELKIRYLESPAFIDISEGIPNYPLPLTWEAFYLLDLQEPTQTLALHAYYSHPVHTALRFLSQPNHWISPYAEFVVTLEDSTSTKPLKSADFMPYLNLILTQWFAASDPDPKMAPTDDFTLETRITHYIDELALAGRAHNWDSQMHLKTSGEGSLQFFDDLHGDNPVCLDGLKTHLYQATLGHPFYHQPALENPLLSTHLIINDAEERLSIAKQVLYDFIAESFKRKFDRLTLRRRELMRTAWGKWLTNEGLSETEQTLLSKLNITSEEQSYFIQRLPIEYPLFKANPALIEFILSRLKSIEEAPIHATLLGVSTNLHAILNPPPPSPLVDYSYFIAKATKHPSFEDAVDNKPEHTGIEWA